MPRVREPWTHSARGLAWPGGKCRRPVGLCSPPCPATSVSPLGSGGVLRPGGCAGPSPRYPVRSPGVSMGLGWSSLGGGFRPSPRPSTACSPARPCVASGVDWKSGWFRSVAWNPPQVVLGTRSALGPAPVCRTFQGGCQCGAQTALESRRGHGLPVARAVGTLGPGHYGRSPGQSPGAWCFRSVCCKGMDERVFRRFEEFAFYMCFFTYTLALFAELMLLTPV